VASGDGRVSFLALSSEVLGEEILKMKAGGVQIVATYVFWIHHEEWKDSLTGRPTRSARLRLAVRTHGLNVYLRIGPWITAKRAMAVFQTGSSKRRFLCAATTPNI